MYAEDIPPVVDSLSPEELGSYILMDRIQTSTTRTNMVLLHQYFSITQCCAHPILPGESWAATQRCGNCLRARDLWSVCSVINIAMMCNRLPDHIKHSCSDEILVNKPVGWLLRSKTASSDETGINAGYVSGALMAASSLWCILSCSRASPAGMACWMGLCWCSADEFLILDNTLTSCTIMCMIVRQNHTEYKHSLSLHTYAVE